MQQLNADLGLIYMQKLDGFETLAEYKNKTEIK